MQKITEREYINIHLWLKRNYGNANKCEAKDCPKRFDIFHWAKIRGRRYKKDRKNFKQLCVGCHTRYDNKWRRCGQDVVVVRDSTTWKINKDLKHKLTMVALNTFQKPEELLFEMLTTQFPPERTEKLDKQFSKSVDIIYGVN